jgi:hypothetical protein
MNFNVFCCMCARWQSEYEARKHLIIIYQNKCSFYHLTFMINTLHLQIKFSTFS